MVAFAVAAEPSLDFLVAEGRGGILGAAGDIPGGSGARRTGWRGVNVSWEMLGREAAGPNQETQTC